MFTHRLAVAPLALVAGMCLPAQAQSRAHAEADHQQAQEQLLPARLAAMAGDWEGQVAVAGAKGATSASLASAAVRVAEDRRCLTVCLDGFVKGESFEGVVKVAVRPDGALDLSAFDSRSNKLTRAEGKAESEAYRFSTKAEGARLEHMVAMKDSRLVIDVVEVAESGSRARVMTFTLDRLPAGKAADAAAKLADGTLLSRVDSPLTFCPFD